MNKMIKNATRIGSLAAAMALAVSAIPSSVDAQVFPGDSRHGGSAGWWNLTPFDVEDPENDEVGARMTVIPDGFAPAGGVFPSTDGLLYTYDSRTGHFTVVDFSNVTLDPRGRATGAVSIQVVDFVADGDGGLEMVAVTPATERVVKGRFRFAERWRRDFRGLADQQGDGILDRRIRHRMNLVARGDGTRTRLRGNARANVSTVNEVVPFNARLNTRVRRQGDRNVRARSTVVITGLQTRVNAPENAPFDAFHFNIDPETFCNRNNQTRRFIGTATMRSVHYPLPLANGGEDGPIALDNGVEEPLSAWQANPGTVRVGYRRYANVNNNRAGNYRITYRARVGRVWHRVGQRGLSLATPQDQMAEALDGNLTPMFDSFYDRAFNASTPAASTRIMSRRSRNDVNLTNNPVAQ